MGEARRRKMMEQQLPALDLSATEEVSSAMRKLATAASSHHGFDCYVHAVIGRHLFAKLGVKVEIAAGFAAWRVGQQDGAVVAHVPNVKGVMPDGVKGFAYHAWLTHGSKIIDITTYQLRQKIAELDAADGGNTQIDWCPDLLVADRTQISSYRQVAQGHTGLFYYEHDARVAAMLAAGHTEDPEDLRIAELIMATPDIRVFGPNSI